MDNESRIVEELVATGKWSRDQARAAVRAEFKCEYCGLDLLKDAQHYKLWELDHVVPKKLVKAEGGDPEELSNLAIACRPCNFSFKRRFDPRKAAGPNADRTALISAARAEIESRKRACDMEVAHVREILKQASGE